VKKLAKIPRGGGWRVHGKGRCPRRGLGYAFIHSAGAHPVELDTD